MRAKRFSAGALALKRAKLNIRVIDEKPVFTGLYPIRDSNRLVEEFMLFANRSVAEKISSHFPEVALLRGHAPPKDETLAEISRVAEEFGHEIDASSSRSLHDSFQKIAQSHPEASQVFQNLAIRSMNSAEYFCTGDRPDPKEWAHYALAMDHYTHFTSPIRRYADVIVHRLLGLAIATQPTIYKTMEVNEISKVCNIKKKQAREAEDRSSLLWTCRWIEKEAERLNLSGKADGPKFDALIIAVLGKNLFLYICMYWLNCIVDRSVDVVITDLALDQRLYMKDDEGYSWLYDEKNITVTFDPDDQTRTNTPTEHAGLPQSRHLLKLSVLKTIRVWVRADMTCSPPALRVGLSRPVMQLN